MPSVYTLSQRAHDLQPRYLLGRRTITQAQRFREQGVGCELALRSAVASRFGTKPLNARLIGSPEWHRAARELLVCSGSALLAFDEFVAEAGKSSRPSDGDLREMITH